MVSNTWMVWVAAVFAGFLAADRADARCAQAPIDRETEGFHVGNGGDVVVQRRDGRVVAIELLDFYEGRGVRGEFVLELGAATLTVQDKVEVALGRLARLDAGRAARYRGWLRDFESETCFMPGIQLTDIPDSQHVQLPAGEGWGIEQIAVHAEPLMPEDYRYVINKDLWDLLDTDGKAGLVLHELIYRDAVNAGVEHSRGVRALNRYAASHTMDAWDFATYVDRLQRVGMGDASYQGMWLDLKNAGNTVFRSDATLASASAVAGSPYESAWGRLTLDCGLAFTADGTVKALSVKSRGARVTIGGIELEIVPPGVFGRDEGCAARYDLYLTYPSQPDRGRARVMTATRVPISGTGFAAVVTEGLTFIDGQLLSGVVDPAAGPAFVDEEGTICELKRGGLVLEGDRVAAANFRKCRVTRGANTFYASGPTRWENRVLVETTLATSQRLLVGTASVVFSTTAPVTFYTTGEVRRGRLQHDLLLPNEHGQPELYFAGATVSFTTDGRVERRPLP